MPLKTFDDRNIQLTDQISHVFQTDSGTNNVTKTHYFDISGDGFVVVSQSVRKYGSVSDYGSSYGDIYVTMNGTEQRVAHSYNRLTTANTEEQGLSMSIGLQVSDGDTIRMYLAQTTNGSKSFYYYILCIGCTATYR